MGDFREDYRAYGAALHTECNQRRVLGSYGDGTAFFRRAGGIHNTVPHNSFRLKISEQSRYICDFFSCYILNNVKPVGADLGYRPHGSCDFRNIPPSVGTGQQMELLEILSVNKAYGPETISLNKIFYPAGHLVEADI